MSISVNMAFFFGVQRSRGENEEPERLRHRLLRHKIAPDLTGHPLDEHIVFVPEKDASFVVGKDGIAIGQVIERGEGGIPTNRLRDVVYDNWHGVYFLRLEPDERFEVGNTNSSGL